MTDAAAAACRMSARIGSAHDHLVMIQPPRHSRRPSPEERRFLDQIVFLRAIYAERGPEDSEPTIGPAAVIAAAELQMRNDRMRGRFAGG